MDDNQQDFAAKLIVIEWEANLVLEDMPPGVIRNRVQNIATVARLLRLRLDAESPRVMNEEQQDFAAKLWLIESEAALVLETLQPGVIRDRIQHIAAVAKLLKARLDAASRPILPRSSKRT